MQYRLPALCVALSVLLASAQALALVHAAEHLTEYSDSTSAHHEAHHDHEHHGFGPHFHDHDHHDSGDEPHDHNSATCIMCAVACIGDDFIIADEVRLEADLAAWQSPNSVARVERALSAIRASRPRGPPAA